MVNVNCDDKEWIRRRQMRIIQVRKQSNDIAKRLRERVVNEERERRVEEKNLLDTKLNIWKVKRLKNLEEMYRKAISDFGTGHKIANEESNPVEEVKSKHEEYLWKAKERGECALELELKEKKEAAEKKQMPIQRKIMTRKIEDLRSSLICSIPVKEPSLILRDIYAGKPFDPKEFESYDYCEPSKKDSEQEEAVQNKDTQPVKSCLRKKDLGKFQQKTKKKIVKEIMPKTRVTSRANKEKASKVANPGCENNWVDLGTVETLMKEEDETKNEKISDTNLQEAATEKFSKREKNSCGREKVLKSDVLAKKVTPIQQKPIIECHGVSLRRNCKLKDSVYVVENPRNNLEPNAIELALKEEEKLLLEKNEKETRENAVEERGNKALEREKITKNYNELLMKLDKLSTKEKLIKSCCHIPPVHLFFSDERRKQKSARKQKIMDSEFERIYYDVTGEKPHLHLNTRLNSGNLWDEVKADSEAGSIVTKLDFSKLDSNLKRNSPASSNGSKSQRRVESKSVRSPVEKDLIKKTSSFHFKGAKMTKGDKALLEIDRILKKCQELRQESRIDRGQITNQPGLECSVKKGDLNLENGDISCQSTENGSIELQFCKSDSSSLREGNRVSDINDLKNSPRRNLSAQQKALLEDLAMGDMPRNFIGIRNNVTAWPVHEINGTNPGEIRSVGSSSTVYMNLPSQLPPRLTPQLPPQLPPEIDTNRIKSMLEILALLKKREEGFVGQEQIPKLENYLYCLLCQAGKKNVGSNKEDRQDFDINPELMYYITRLLDLSREAVADLSLSSESDDSLKAPPFCDNQPKPSAPCAENKCLKQTEDECKVFGTSRAKELAELIQRWKKVLEQMLDTCSLEDDLSDSDEYENAVDCAEKDEKKDEGKYEEIAKTCQERMAIISRIVADCISKGYLPKPGQAYGATSFEGIEVLQGLENEGQDVNQGPGNNIPEGFCFPDKESEEQPGAKPQKIVKTDNCKNERCPSREPFGDGNNANCQKTGVDKSDTSMESFPNVMEELLKKKIITSPFQWHKGNVVNDYGPKGSCHSQKIKGGLPREGLSKINHVDKLPDKNEQECPKPKLNKSLYQPCKDSCKGSCSIEANNLNREVKESAKKSPEKIVPAKALPCVAKAPTKVVKKPPREWKGPMRYCDPAYGIFSPLPDSCRETPGPSAPANEGISLLHPNQLFQKRRHFTTTYFWDENKQKFVQNTNDTAVSPTRRPFHVPQDWKSLQPTPTGINITSVKKAPGAPRRPSSSPGYIPRMNSRNSGSESWREELNKSPCSDAVPGDESDNEIMEEWNRRDTASKIFNKYSGSPDGCVGSCVVHCGNYGDSQKRVKSSSNVRRLGRGPTQDLGFSRIRYANDDKYRDGYEDGAYCIYGFK